LGRSGVCPNETEQWKKFKYKNKNSFYFMAKKSMIEREKKRQNLVIKYAKKRNQFKQEIKEASFLEEKLKIHRKLQGLPRNSAPVRLHNRCLITGRPKGYFRDFGVSRHLLREMAHNCFLPGVTKSSW
jgi:small subunit ribosomal protein S14